MAREDNLKPHQFKKGENGGHHRPKGRHKLETVVKRALSKIVDEKTGESVYDQWARAISSEAVQKPSSAVSIALMDREWPKVSKLHLGGDEDAPPIQVDFRRLTKAEIGTFRKLLKKAMVGGEDDDKA